MVEDLSRSMAVGYNDVDIILCLARFHQRRHYSAGRLHHAARCSVFLIAKNTFGFVDSNWGFSYHSCYVFALLFGVLNPSFGMWGAAGIGWVVAFSCVSVPLYFAMR